jgi:predicted nucleic acid-binding protein
LFDRLAGLSDVGAQDTPARVTAGATLDALIGWTAKLAGATLLTRDIRAVPTYERLTVAFESLA